MGAPRLSLVNRSLLAGVVIALSTLTVDATTLAFLDGTTWTDAEIISHGPTSIIVLHGGAVETVHATQLTTACMVALELRPPTEEELADRAAAAQCRQDEAAERQLRLWQLEAEQAVHAARVETERKERDRLAPEVQPAPPQVVRESSSVVADNLWGFVTETWIDGRVLSRVGKAAIIQADGPPSGEPQRRKVGWVQGTVFIHEDNRLNATVRDSPVSGRVIPAGEYRHTDSNGIVHIIAAYRLY